MTRRRGLVAVIAVALIAVGVLVGNVIAQSSTPTAVRQPLAQSTVVKGAKNTTLGLSRVTIPVGATIALHHHQGTQVAYIQAGTLTYTVQSGSVTVMGGPSDAPNVVRKIKAGQTGKILAGQWIVEQPTTIHTARNAGTAKVVIYLSTLLKTGAPPSTPN
jgi:quercetin dioxygenase-like cupin family protein